jgi:hypothetical protein
MRTSAIFGQSIRAAIVAGVLAVTAATSAPAKDLRQGVHTVTPLGDRSFAVTRWVDGPDGFHVLTIVDTLRPGIAGLEEKDRHATVRLSTVLLPGQTQTVAVPEGPRGSSPSSLQVRRVGDRVEMHPGRPAVLTD